MEVKMVRGRKKGVTFQAGYKPRVKKDKPEEDKSEIKVEAEITA